MGTPTAARTTSAAGLMTTRRTPAIAGTPKHHTGNSRDARKCSKALATAGKHAKTVTIAADNIDDSSSKLRHYSTVEGGEKGQVGAVFGGGGEGGMLVSCQSQGGTHTLKLV